MRATPAELLAKMGVALLFVTPSFVLGSEALWVIGFFVGIGVTTLWQPRFGARGRARRERALRP